MVWYITQKNGHEEEDLLKIKILGSSCPLEMYVLNINDTRKCERDKMKKKSLPSLVSKKLMLEKIHIFCLYKFGHIAYVSNFSAYSHFHANRWNEGNTFKETMYVNFSNPCEIRNFFWKHIDFTWKNYILMYVYRVFHYKHYFFNNGLQS